MRALAWVALLLVPSFATAQSVSVSATHKQKEPLELSEHIRVTVAVEGPAPLRVELPDPLLAPESLEICGMWPVGRATVKPAGPGREVWEQEFRFEPYAAGEWYVRFGPVKVNGREVDGPGFAIAVKREEMQPPQGVTGIEQLSPVEPTGTSLAAVWWAAGTLVVVALAVVAWCLRPRPAPPTPREWAANAVEKLESDGTSRAALVRRVAAILRPSLQPRFGIPATRFTTPNS